MPLDDAMARFRSAFRQQVDGLMDQRLAELETLLGQEKVLAARATSERLNHTARRLRQTETIEEWKNAVAEAALAFCGGAAVYDAGADDVAPAPAIATAVETKDTVVTLRSASELPAAVLGRFGAADGSRCYLFPILYGSRVAAILYAQPGPAGVDVNGLELLAALAGATIPKPAAPKLVMPAVTPQGRKAAAPQWTALTHEEQQAHLRAQRFARVRVAEMRLYEAEAVQRGRESRNLYLCLQGKIDFARNDFRKEFVEKCPSMTDYLHRELVRTLANDDETAMGQEYPGALA